MRDALMLVDGPPCSLCGGSMREVEKGVFECDYCGRQDDDVL